MGKTCPFQHMVLEKLGICVGKKKKKKKKEKRKKVAPIPYTIHKKLTHNESKTQMEA